MQPLGRKKIQLPEAKHHPKESGKNLNGWWEDIVSPSKTAERFAARMEIKKEISEVPISVKLN